MTTPADYRAALAEIADLLSQATDPDDLGIRAGQTVAKIRELLAAPEAVGVTDEELLSLAHAAELLEKDGTTGYREDANLTDPVLAFARAVLSRYGTAQPAPVPVGDLRYEFSVFDDQDEEQAGGDAPTLQDAIREGRHYLAMYGNGHRLELREARTLPLPGDQP